MKLQLATWNFLVNYLEINEEKENLTKIFKTLDINGDGHLSREELVKGFS